MSYLRLVVLYEVSCIVKMVRKNIKKILAFIAIFVMLFMNIALPAEEVFANTAENPAWWTEAQTSNDKIINPEGVNTSIVYDNDEYGQYPNYNDYDINAPDYYEHIGTDKVLNPNTGVTSPSIAEEIKELAADDPKRKLRENRTLEYEEGWVTKYAEEGNNQGETEVNLRIEGKDERPVIDIVMLIDNSNSMKESDDYSEGLTRAQSAQKAAFEFIDAFSGEGFENVGIAAVVYGSTVFDGRTDLTVQRRQMNVPYVGRPKSVHAYLDSYRGSTKNLSVKSSSF